jgi:protein involved in polysaccharide export with SLBB domain
VQPPAGIAAFDPNHVMAPGDVVQIHIYGATTLDQQATVDSNGDIFLPTIGPVHIAGTLAGNLQAVVEHAISSVYQSTAQVYVTLASAIPVNVFVTGAVVSPGQYAQPSTASVITFLQAAGGIDPKRGSYRDIEVLRNGRPIVHVDLYHFLLNGHLPPLRLQERDTILVRPQGATVAAVDDVTGVFRYELRRPETGAQLIALARPYPDATRVHLIGIRAGRPAAFDYNLAEFRRVPIQNGDIAQFVPDRPTNVMSVKFEGRFDGPSNLVVRRQATLFDVLPYLKVDPYFADTSAVYVRRLSVAQAQKKAIDDQLQRLKAAVVTSPTITEEQAKQQEAEAKVIFQYAEQLSNVKPEGRLIVEHHGQLENVRLEDGDVIVIPSRTDLVLVSGEIRLPQAVVYLRGAPIEHYIAAAGGFTERADDDKLLVIRPSGETLTGAHPPISPGDRIIVLPAPSNFAFSLAKDLTTILYNVAVTAGVALANIKL